MSVDIGPKIGIDGEAQFRKQINDLTQQIKTFGSEMKAVTSAVDGNEESIETLDAKNQILTKTIDAQTQKLEELKKGLKAASEEFGDADRKTQRWQQAVYDAESDLNKLKNQLRDNENVIENFGKEVEDVGDSLEDAGKSAIGFGDILKANLTSEAIIGAIKGIGSELKQMAEDSREFRKIMGSLEVSSEAAGYSAEETSAAYNQLYGVLADNQTAATTTANLQAIGLEQDKLQQLIDGTIGAWAKYGDSIPIDGLAEAINETVKVGAVTGTFADVLNWAGGNEDAFNEKLQAATSESERANIVMKELADQGLMQAGKQWQENNRSLVEANKATAEYEAATARLGEVAEPVLTTVTTLTADFIHAIVDNKEAVIATIAGIGTGLLAWNVVTMVQGLVGAITAFRAANEGATIAQAALNVVMNANPIGIVVTALAAVVGALVAFAATNEEVRVKVAEVWGAIKEGVSIALEAMKGLLSDAWAWINGETDGQMSVLQAYVVNCFEGIKVAVQSAIELVKGIMQAGLQIINGDWSGAWETIKLTFCNIWENIKTYAQEATENMHAAISNKVRDIATSIKEGLEGAVQYVKELPGKFLEWGKDMIQNLIDGIMSKVSGVANAIGDIASTIREYIHFSEPDVGPLSDFHTYMPDMTKMLTSGIRAGIPQVEKAMNELSASMVPTYSNGTAAAYDRMAAVMGNMQIVLDDGTLVGKLAPGIDRKMGGYTKIAGRYYT